MGFFDFGKAHTGPLYGFLPSADIGRVVYYLTHKSVALKLKTLNLHLIFDPKGP